MSNPTKKNGRRVLEPSRAQATIHFEIPDDVIAEDHPARLIWMLVQQLDLTKVLLKSRSVEGHAGRPSISPALKLTLWLYAISKGIGSAREIACGRQGAEVIKPDEVKHRCFQNMEAEKMSIGKK